MTDRATGGASAAVDQRASRNGHADRPSKLGVVPPKSKVRLPELAVGVLVTVAFALAAVLWHLNSVSRTPALAVATAVERGDVLDHTDLKTVYVSEDTNVAHLDPAEATSVIGRVASIDLSVGTLLVPDLVSDPVSIGPSDGVAGLLLDPGQYPALGLAPGDEVAVVRSATATSPNPGGESTKASTDIVVADATVYAVEDLASERKLVSILTHDEAAAQVAAEAGDGSLRLVLVGR